MNALQANQNQIRRGDIELPDRFNKQLNRLWDEVVDKFIRQGKSSGGRNGNPWADKVVTTHIMHLEWWQQQLSLASMADLNNCLPDVEDALLDLVEERDLCPKTRNDYLNSLYALCTFAKKRKYLREHPLLDITWLPNKPSKRNMRRDFTEEEVALLFKNTPSYRSIAYEVAASTGFRRRELASLTMSHLHVEEGILDLYAEDDKARVERHHPIPHELARKLEAFGRSGEALRQYERFTARYDAKVEYPDNPLLFIPEHTSRMLEDDLERLDIPRKTSEGKLDFHCWRVHYINKLIEATDNIKVIQELARHSDIRITMKVYARVKGFSAKGTVEDTYRLIHGQGKVQ